MHLRTDRFFLSSLTLILFQLLLRFYLLASFPLASRMLTNTLFFSFSFDLLSVLAISSLSNLRSLFNRYLVSISLIPTSYTTFFQSFVSLSKLFPFLRIIPQQSFYPSTFQHSSFQTDIVRNAKFFPPIFLIKSQLFPPIAVFPLPRLQFFPFPHPRINARNIPFPGKDVMC